MQRRRKQRYPGLVHDDPVNAQPLAPIDGVVDDSLLERRLPRDAKFLGKLLLPFSRRVELRRLAQRSLCAREHRT